METYKEIFQNISNFSNSNCNTRVLPQWVNTSIVAIVGSNTAFQLSVVNIAVQIA